MAVEAQSALDDMSKVLASGFLLYCKTQNKVKILGRVIEMGGGVHVSIRALKNVWPTAYM
jgi:hypothetical protein